MKKVVAFLLLSVILIAGCSGQPTGTAANLGEQFSLAPDQQASITGEPLQIKFLQVVNDSRCASGVVCIWAGEVGCLVEIIYNGSSTKETFTQSGSSDAVTYFNDYEIAFTVQPYPKAGQTIEKNDYRLQLTVNKQ